MTETRWNGPVPAQPEKEMNDCRSEDRVLLFFTVKLLCTAVLFNV